MKRPLVGTGAGSKLRWSRGLLFCLFLAVAGGLQAHPAATLPNGCHSEEGSDSYHCHKDNAGAGTSLAASAENVPVRDRAAAVGDANGAAAGVVGGFAGVSGLICLVALLAGGAVLVARRIRQSAG
jgi:hypothetical protein